jgi:hypothetical protein
MVMDNPITGAIKEAAQMTNITQANLSVDELERVSGGNTWLLVSARQPSSPHRQPIDPNPSMGSGYGGDSAGGSGGGGYFGDPNAPGHQQF